MNDLPRVDLTNVCFSHCGSVCVSTGVYRETGVCGDCCCVDFLNGGRIKGAIVSL